MSELSIHDTGEGPALLLLHAYPLDASMWDAQVAALSGRYRCLRPDFWGCGTSPPPPGGVTIDGYAALLLGELDERGIADFAVCGSSMGGYMTLALLRAASRRVRAVALAGTRAAADDDDARAARMEVADQVRSLGVEAVVEPMTEKLLCPRCRGEVHIADPVRGRIRRCSPAGVIAAIEAIAGRPDSTPMLGNIRVPALVVCGTDDGIVPLDESRGMAAAIPHAQLHEFEGSAHLPSLEQPMAFSALLGSFLDVATTGA
ncbi:MAG: alpha/beta fold hydrolase [Candidatus Dormibacteraeota bacterium]|uniref:Alpha/beta fold hydrolase n=2 Tax=Candidatus Aeolococcus gillhamiae TaxID=3127015 RepID=A0A934MZE0_9BACT|nr:alpha/beta fold hydrolase [Candidatus Dormibacteraeota bacterium]